LAEAPPNVCGNPPEIQQNQNFSSVIDNVLLHPFPYTDSARIYGFRIVETNSKAAQDRNYFSSGDALRGDRGSDRRGGGGGVRAIRARDARGSGCLPALGVNRCNEGGTYLNR
jgi:hypothetical protein